MRHRHIGIEVGMIVLGLPLMAAQAEERKSDRIVTGVISGLLGGPQQAPDAAYTAQERERLVSLLQSGDYATSRQGEPIDMMVFGVPLTRAEHVYSAKPVQPSRITSP